MKILVADDDETIRVLVTRLFARRGDTVEAVRDGAEAIAKLETESFDLVILDLMMPRIDGLGVLSFLAGRDLPSPKVIVMTAASPGIVENVSLDQVVAVVTKPFDIENLMRIADDAISSKQRELS